MANSAELLSWLTAHNLAQYAELLERQQVGLDILGELDDADLEKLGIPLGDRKRFRKALQELAASSEATPRAIPSAGIERRQLTVMFCDLVGSVALAQQLDPEELRALIQSYRAVCASVIARYDGYIARHVGDGILTYFGWPRAHEDDAERSVRAGLEVVRAVKAIAAPQPLAVHIGIATGPVVVGEEAGESAEAKLAVGATPNLAARLQQLAGADQIVIASATRTLVGNAFELSDLGEQMLKGMNKPEHAFSVARVHDSASRFDAAARGRLTQMVGREQEIGLLQQRWQLARSGEGQVVLLSGEAGIGKSRMLSAFRERLGEEIEVPLHYQCSPYHSGTALYPIIQHLQRALRFAPDESDEQKLDKLERRLMIELGRARAGCHLVGAMLSLNCEARYGKLGLSSQRQKDETLQVLVDVMAAVAERQAAVVLFEDVHWADPTTIEALSLLVDRAESLPLLVLISHRPEFVAPWSARAHVTPVTLTRLSRAQSANVVQGVAASKALPSDLVARIVDRTDGVPLFLEEFTKAVLESGMLIDQGERYEHVGDLSKIAVPATLHDSLMARLDRLNEAKEVAQIGAALGREFDYELLSVVSPVKEPELSRALEKLVNSELVFRRGGAARQTYVFKHALVQSEAYDSMLKGKRVQLHTSIAQALEQRFRQTVEAQPELLAHHCTEAKLVSRAIPYWLKAGQHAAARSANAEAITHLNKGLQLVGTLPETPERNQQELALQIALGMPLMTTRGYAAPDVERTFSRARELCAQAQASPQLFAALYGLRVFHFVRADLRALRELDAQLLGLAEALQDTALRMQAHHLLGTGLFHRGDFVAARRHFETCLSLYDADAHGTHALVYGQDPGVVSLCYLALILCVLGYPDSAVTKSSEAVALAHRLSYPHSLAFALTWVAILHQLRREPAKAAEQADAVLRLSAEQALPVFQAMGGILRGWAYVAEGRATEGNALARQCVTGWTASGARLWLPYFRTLLAEIVQHAGAPEESDSELAAALSSSLDSGDAWALAEVHRCTGEMLLSHHAADARGVRRLDDAQAQLQSAIDIARQQQARLFELRATLSLARCWQQQGRAGEASSVLKPITEWFNEGFEGSDLQQANALRRELFD